MSLTITAMHGPLYVKSHSYIYLFIVQLTKLSEQTMCNSRTWPLKINTHIDCLHTKIFQREKTHKYVKLTYCVGDRSGTVIKMLRYKSDGRWFDPRWCHWNVSLT
jgi:hypothetical protein